MGVFTFRDMLEIISVVVTQIWEIATMISDIVSIILLFTVLFLTVFIRIALWIPGEQPEKFLIKVRDYLNTFIGYISAISKKRKP